MSTLASSTRRGVADAACADGVVHVGAGVHVTGDLALAGSDVRGATTQTRFGTNTFDWPAPSRGREIDDAVLLPVQVAQVHDQPAYAQPVAVRGNRRDRGRVVRALPDAAPEVEVRGGCDSAADGQRDGRGNQPAGPAPERQQRQQRADHDDHDRRGNAPAEGHRERRATCQAE